MKIWCENFDGETYTDARIKDIRRFLGVPLMSGRSIKDKFPEHTCIVIRSSGLPTDFFMAGPMPVFSEKAKHIIDQDRIAAEWYPLNVLSQNGESLGIRYYYLNLLEVIDCFSRELSVFTPKMDFATRIERVVLRMLPLSEPPLYLVAKTSPVLLCASDGLAQTITQASCTGVKFKSPQEWRNPTKPQ